MKNKIRIDVKRRQLFAKKEKQRMALKYLVLNNNVSKKHHWNCFFRMAGLSRNSTLSRIRNLCVRTGRARAVFKKFKISRIELRRLASFGLIPGMSKASW